MKEKFTWSVVIIASATFVLIGLALITAELQERTRLQDKLDELREVMETVVEKGEALAEIEEEETRDRALAEVEKMIYKIEGGLSDVAESYEKGAITREEAILKLDGLLEKVEESTQKVEALLEAQN